MRLSTIAVLISLGLSLAPAVRVQAGEGDWSFGGGGVFASFPTEEEAALGFGATGYARYGLMDQLSANLGALYSYHPPTPLGPEGEEADLHVIVTHLGLVWALDIIEVVPYVLLDATMYFADATFFREDGRNLGFGLLFGLGFDYRRWKSMSLGVEVAYHAFFSDIANYPVYINVNFHITYHYVEPW